MILGGKTLAAKPALKCGMIDDIVPREYLVEKACQLILRRGAKLRVRPKRLTHSIAKTDVVMNLIGERRSTSRFCKRRVVTIQRFPRRSRWLHAA